MTVPVEFTPEYIERHSHEGNELYTVFLESGEPWKSMIANNPWMKPPRPGDSLPDDPSRYWNTTTGRKHPYWSNQKLPDATKDINQLRADLAEWGYCLIEDGLSRVQCEHFNAELERQAEGERAAGVDMQNPAGQQINTLINKGEVFGLCIEQHPDAVQAGPLIEQITNETLGPGWICHSFLAIGARPGGHPQGLHFDQGPLLPWVTEEAPALLNTMYIPTDVDDENGGTLIIPGSHKKLIEAGSGGAIGELPPAINLEARAGTIMLFDGRILHGTGLNRSSKDRYVAVMSNVKSWMRTQENWVISVAPDVLAGASDKLRHRIGFQALTYGSTIEGFGMGAPGRVGDARGDIEVFRSAYDEGRYERVRALSADSPAEDLDRDYTIKAANARVAAARERRKQAAEKAPSD